MGFTFSPVEGPYGSIDVPLDDLTVEEQRRIRVSPAIVGGVERAEPKLGLGDDHVARLDLVVEEVVKLARIEHRDGGRQLAIRYEMDAIRRRVDAMRAVRYGDVAGVRRPMPPIEHRNSADFFEVALLDRLLDALDVEDHDPVLLIGHHLRQRDALFRVVAGRPAVFALVVGVDVIEIAVDVDLPRYLHRVAIDRGEQCGILFGIVEDLAVIGDGDAILAVAVDIPGPRIFLDPQSMHRRLVRQLDDLVALHDVEPDASDPRVRLVIHEQVAPVIRAVGKGEVGMVEIAIEINPAPALQEFAQLRRQSLGQNLAALVSLAPARGAAAVEHGNAHQLAHRGQAKDAHFASLPAGREHVILIELPRCDFRLGVRTLRGLRRHGLRLRSTKPNSYNAGGPGCCCCRSRSKHASPGQPARVVFALVCHGNLLRSASATCAILSVLRFCDVRWIKPPNNVFLGVAGAPRIEGEERASRLARLSRIWIMCGQR